MRVALLPIIPWNPIVQQRPHHMSAQFGINGHTVNYIDAHSVPSRPSVQQVGKNIYNHRIRWAQYHLFKKGKHSDELVNYIVNLQSDVLFINAPYWADVAIGVKKKRKCVIVYDILDHFEGFEDIAKMGEPLRSAHKRLIDNADLVTHTSHILRPEHPNTLYLPNACDFNHWNIPRRPGGKPGYFGCVAFWFDYNAIRRIDVEIVGPGAKSSIPYPELPRAASKWGVGLIPHKECGLTKAMNPVKLYEYMALGLPVISTDLDEVRVVVEEMAANIRPVLVAGGKRWGDIIDKVVSKDTNTLIQGRKVWAKKQQWKHRYHEVESALNSLI